MTTEPPPHATALEWAAEAAGPGTRIRQVRRLPGGPRAVTHLLTCSGPVPELVLRRFRRGDRAAVYEALALAAIRAQETARGAHGTQHTGRGEHSGLATHAGPEAPGGALRTAPGPQGRCADPSGGLGGRVPRLVAADVEGRRCGAPTTLLTRVPGRPGTVPGEPAVAAAQLGRTLARVHAVPPTGLDGPDGLRDGMAAAAEAAPGGPAVPVLAVHGKRLAAEERVLTHCAFRSGNVLWEGEVLSGVVGWSGAALAPRGLDVSRCRLDLMLLYGPEAAETFLTAYEETAGRRVLEAALWDLHAVACAHRSVEQRLPLYRSLGRTGMTALQLRERHAAWTGMRLACFRAAVR